MNREQKEQAALNALALYGQGLTANEKTSLSEAMIVLIDDWQDKGLDREEITRRFEVMARREYEPWMDE